MWVIARRWSCAIVSELGGVIENVARCTVKEKVGTTSVERELGGLGVYVDDEPVPETGWDRGVGVETRNDKRLRLRGESAPVQMRRHVAAVGCLLCWQDVTVGKIRAAQSERRHLREDFVRIWSYWSFKVHIFNHTGLLDVRDENGLVLCRRVRIRYSNKRSKGGLVDNRLALARQALQVAEERAGLRVVRSHSASWDTETTDAFAVPPVLRAAFPMGIARGKALRLTGSMAFAALVAGIASRQGAWVAIIGVPNIGWSFFEASGMECARCAYIADVDAQAPQVVSAAIEGFDVVIIGDLRIDRREQAVLERRMKSRNGILLTLGRWMAPALDVTCCNRGVTGLATAPGHITAVNYAVETRWGSAHLTFAHDGWAHDHTALTALRVVGSQSENAQDAS